MIDLSKTPVMVFFLMLNGGDAVQDQKNEQNNMISIGNTAFYVTSRFLGVAELSYLIKRLIKKEMEQGN